MASDVIRVERESGAPFATITLNRQDDWNRLSESMMTTLAEALTDLENNNEIGCVVLTGAGKHFCAGINIDSVQDLDFIRAYREGAFAGVWDCISNCRKPVIAAVNGIASGAGLELAMMSDFILAASDARFSQPEINMASVPASGGAHRLARLVGKSKAMEMCLTGREVSAEEAERAGLVARVVPAGDLMEEAARSAKAIATKSQPVVMMVKECVNAADESFLTQGVLLERRLCHATFALEDHKEGLEAILEKRAPNFRQR